MLGGANMQNERKKDFRSFAKEKGYYIVLLLCAAAVGVSGYFLLRTNDETAEETPVAATDESTADLRETTAETTSEEVTAPNKKNDPVKLVRPVDGEALTAFAIDRLMYNETTRDWRTHEGVDLCAELGERVCAVMDGTVHTIYEDENYGVTVVLTHSGGYTTHYANLAEEISVAVGDSVTAGDTIGTVGQTANIETGIAPHLHFAVYQNNSAADPMQFLPEE